METNKDSRLKICWMRIVGFQQFQDVFLDFTHPDTGEPLDKICFIGANGTGKSKLLELLIQSIDAELKQSFSGWENAKAPKLDYWIATCFAASDLQFVRLHSNHFEVYFPISRWHAIEETLQNGEVPDDLLKITINTKPNDPVWSSGIFDSKGVTVWCQSDPFLAIPIPFDDLPRTNLEAALTEAVGQDPHVLVTPFNIVGFWNELLRNLYTRQKKLLQFLYDPKNNQSTVGALTQVFEEQNPSILRPLEQVWNRILHQANLELDIQSIYIPIDPIENLRAYIRLIGDQSIVPYRQISSGIRSYIFTVGHILSLNWDKKTNRRFLLVDEPENGLYPDFLYDLVDVYRQVTTDKNGANNTQMFFATHEPIIAAQFEPYERIILEWNDDGTVRSRRGTSPIGDDPNDVLKQDFGVQSLMGAPGKVAFARYRKLKSLLKTESDPSAKEAITTEYLELGRLYNFPA